MKYTTVKMPHRQWAILCPNGTYIFYRYKREATIVCDRLNAMDKAENVKQDNRIFYED